VRTEQFAMTESTRAEVTRREYHLLSKYARHGRSVFINSAGREFVKLKNKAYACLSCGYVYTRQEAKYHGQSASNCSCPVNLDLV